MSQSRTDRQLPIEITADRADALLPAAVARLREELLGPGAWDGAASVTPWQADAPDAARLAAAAARAMLDAPESGALVDLELAGTLRTDTGVRAWGTVATRDAGDALPRVAEATVSEAGDGWRLTLTLAKAGIDDG